MKLNLLKSIFRLTGLGLYLFNVSCSDGNGNSGAEATPDAQRLPVTSFLIGNPNIITAPEGGICMMGGRTENDNAMRWFLNRAKGGDVLVMRASGSDAYNTYFYGELGVQINSVETLVFSGKTESEEIISKIDQAEAIWFAGGDQGKYMDYWKGNAVESALQRAVDRGGVIGGTSAGMAVLGEFIWTGDEIVSGFLDIPFMEDKITDTHFSERNRLERLEGFIGQTGAKGIAADEYTAICVDGSGMARVYGDAAGEDIAYFIDETLEVVTLKGDSQGSATFDVSNWE